MSGESSGDLPDSKTQKNPGMQRETRRPQSELSTEVDGVY